MRKLLAYVVERDLMTTYCLVQKGHVIARGKRADSWRYWLVRLSRVAFVTFYVRGRGTYVPCKSQAAAYVSLLST